MHDARTGADQIRVFILDDHAQVREALAEYLGADPQITVVGTAGAVEEALDGIAASEPSVAVLDVRLREGSGLDVCREVRVRHPEVACLLLTSHSDGDALVAARLAGASGYLVKQPSGDGLLAGIRTVAGGGSLLPGDGAELQPHIDELCARRAVRLSAEQQLVLAKALDGSTNREIADATHQTATAVRGHLDAIFADLGLAG